MDLNHRDAIALRAALEKLSASASAMADASNDIKHLVSKLDSQPNAAPVSKILNSERLPSPIAATTHNIAAPQPQVKQSHPLSAQIPTTATSPSGMINKGSQESKTAIDIPDKTLSARKVIKPTAYPRPKYPTPQRRPTKSSLSTEEKLMRAVAIGGAAITIAGIILLVTVAVQRGWLGPVGRVIGAYLLSFAFLGAAIWVRNRGTRISAIVALIVTSQMAAVATTFAITYILEWVSLFSGSLLILLINIVFLLIARQWTTVKKPTANPISVAADTRPTPDTFAVLLAVAIVSGLTAWFASSSADGWCAILGIIAALAISTRRSTALVRGTLGAMAVFLQFMLINATVEAMWASVFAGVATALLLVALSIWDPTGSSNLESNAHPVQHYWRSFETNPAASWAGVVVPIIIVLQLSAQLNSLQAIWWTLVPAVVMAAMGISATLIPSAISEDLTSDTTLTEHNRLVRLIAVSALVLIAGIFVIIRYSAAPNTSGILFHDAIPVISYLIAGSILFTWLRTFPADKTLGILPWIAWLLGAVAITGVLFRNVIMLSPLWLTDTAALVQGFLILVFIAATILARNIFYNHPLWLQLLAGATILCLSATAIVTIFTYFGQLLLGTTGMQLGFLIGHATVSILWMAIAAGLMLSRRLLNLPGALWTGVGLAIAGTIKLVFFDLVALSGVPRASAFLLSGIALLTIASLRGRQTSKILKPAQATTDQAQAK